MQKLSPIIILLYFFARPTSLQLLINVKNQGGDVMQENITANVSEDTVTLEFLRLDGVHVSQLVDFTNVGLEQSSYSSAVTAFPAHALASDSADGLPGVTACVSETDQAKECLCHLEVCVNWYPCGLKYCKGKPQGGLSYRCGIKTCRRCYRYHFYVRRRDACLAYT
ncbi:hypothetical protein O0L34_g2004 [Tuta absoluta]|nr:hypothetical protein O0L34_g2004 [Tuta absoluta]